MKFDEIVLNENALAAYPNIALDVDDTLIGDNPKKEKLWQFIVDNQTKHKFYIVTFRFGAAYQSLWSDLTDETSGTLKPQYFQGAFTPGRELHLDYLKYIQIAKIANKEKALRKIKQENIDWNKTRQGAKELLIYKGKTCWFTGCGILVDDDKKRVIEGCIEYKITYLHPSQV